MLLNVADLATCCGFCPKLSKNGQLFFYIIFVEKKVYSNKKNKTYN